MDGGSKGRTGSWGSTVNVGFYYVSTAIVHINSYYDEGAIW